MKNISNTFS